MCRSMAVVYLCDTLLHITPALPYHIKIITCNVSNRQTRKTTCSIKFTSQFHLLALEQLLILGVLDYIGSRWILDTDGRDHILNLSDRVNLLGVEF